MSTTRAASSAVRLIAGFEIPGPRIVYSIYDVSRALVVEASAGVLLGIGPATVVVQGGSGNPFRVSARRQGVGLPVAPLASTRACYALSR